MNEKNNNDAILNAILGAAIMGSTAEKAETPEEPTPKHAAAAREARKLYDAFVEEGFTAEQATTFVAAIMS